MCNGAVRNRRMHPTTCILRTGSRQESKSKCEASASANFTESAPPYKNYPMLTKKRPVSDGGIGQMLLDTCTCASAGASG